MSDEELAAYQEAAGNRWGEPVNETPPGSEPTEDEGEEQEGEEQEGEEQTPPTPTPPSPATEPTNFDLGDGRVLSRDQAQAYYQFDQYLTANPQFKEYLQRWGQQPTPTAPTGGPTPTGTPTPSPTSPPVELPEGLDLDDPGIKFLVDQQKELQRQLASLSQVTSVTQHQLQQRQEQDALALVNRAVTTFQATNHLTDDEIAQVRAIAGRINAVDSYMKGVHPITGALVQPDILAAMDTALSVALNTLPEVVQRVNTQALSQQLSDKKRKTNAAKLTSGGGSTPRTPPPAKNRQELKSQFVEEVRTMMFGSEQ